MIVNDLHFVSVAFAPVKAEPPSVVDADAGLPFAITVQAFQAIAWRRSQVAQFRGAVELSQLPPSDSLDDVEAFAALAVK